MKQGSVYALGCGPLPIKLEDNQVLVWLLHGSDFSVHHILLHLPWNIRHYFFFKLSGMFNNPRTQTETVRRPTIMNPQPNPFEKAFLGVESDIIQNGLGAYGEKIMESSSKYVQSNMSRYFSDPQYYFQVNDHYVGNKLKVILFPFIHRGHWSRIREPIDGKLSYKPPIYDINAPDLYIPLMAFGTYIVLSGVLLGLQGKFSTEALNKQFTKGLFVWFFEAMLLKSTLLSLGSDEAPVLDIVAYSGYAFTGVVVSLLAKIVWVYSYYVVMIWECLCMGVFFVKILKRIVFAEVCTYRMDSSKRHYMLLLVAIAQIPLLFWLSNICA